MTEQLLNVGIKDFNASIPDFGYVSLLPGQNFVLSYARSLKFTFANLHLQWLKSALS